MTCPKCKVELVPGIALMPTNVASPDFIGDSEGCTVSGLDNKLVDCLKCPECGHSVTEEKE